MQKQSKRGVLAIVGFLGLVGLLSVEAYRSDISVTKDSIGALIDVVEHLEQIGEIVGAQVLVGHGDRVLAEKHIGVVAPDRQTRVDAETMFCIGSTSKPFTSTVAMSLVDEGVLELDRPIDVWLPQFGDLAVAGGEPAVRAPTLRELLIHRSGIFSQQMALSDEQRNLIRDFSSSLEESVDGIANQELIAQAGKKHAYSGAGYCVIGRIAEVVTGRSFDVLLQERICRPLGLERTTYFPPLGDHNVSAGAKPGTEGQKVHEGTPHLLGAGLKFPLIGGGIYSTAGDLARFSRMIIQQGQFGSHSVLTRDVWFDMTSRQQPEGPRRLYGMGWVLTVGTKSDRPTWVGHTGALASSRATLKIALGSGHYIIVLYSVTDDDRQADDQINNAVDMLMRAIG